MKFNNELIDLLDQEQWTADQNEIEENPAFQCYPWGSYTHHTIKTVTKMDSELKVQDQRWQQRRVDSLLTQNNNLFETENLPKIDT